MRPLLFALLAVCFASRVPAQEFHITGSIAGIESGTATLIDLRDENGQVLATSPIESGAYALRGMHPYFGQAYLQPVVILLQNTSGSQSKRLVTCLERMPMVVHSTSDGNYFYGSPELLRLSAAQQEADFCTAAIVRWLSNREYQLASGEPATDSLQHYRMRYETGILNFVRENLHSPISENAWLLAIQSKVTELLSSASLDSLYTWCPQSRKAFWKSWFCLAVEKAKPPVAGDMAPDFALATASGDSIRLSDFRGKYVLLDFWASWCVPCIREIPLLKEIYHKYRPKGLEIVAISTDGSRDKWLAALEKHGTPWTQVHDAGHETIRAATRYGVETLPTHYLVGPDGKIIANGMSVSELDTLLSQVCNPDRQ